MERDEETGLSYHNARYYIPWLGRWLNCDPIGIRDGVNVYAYCRNNPVNGTDTSGTQFNKPYVAKQDNARAQPSIDFKTLMQAGEKQAAANTAKAAAEHNRQVNSNNSNFYGSNDPAYYAIKGDNEMAKFVSTKNLAQKEGSVMGILIWTGYGLDKVGEYGSVVVATGGARGSYRLPTRESNGKAPIDAGGNGAFKPDPRSFSPPPGGAQPNTGRKGELLKDPDANQSTSLKNNGSGPVSGVIEISANIQSNKAFKNYTPNTSIEFVYDSVNNIFVVGKPTQNSGGSPHQQLAKSINSTDRKNIVGGLFRADGKGNIFTNENSGHYGENWTPEIRQQFVQFMKDQTGMNITHDHWK